MDPACDSDLSDLLRDLQDPSGTTAEDAKFELERRYGASAIPYVLELLPTLEMWPRVCAIDMIAT